MTLPEDEISFPQLAFGVYTSGLHAGSLRASKRHTDQNKTQQTALL